MGDADYRWRWREAADVLAFVAVGDMVLDSLARAILASRNRQPPIPSGAWRRLLHAADDPATPRAEQRAIRRLQFSLRDARHRLLAHRRVDHGEIVQWEHDDSPVITLVAVSHGSRVASAIGDLNRTLDPPLPDEVTGNPQVFLELMVGRAPELSAGQLLLLSNVAAESGYVSTPVASVVEDVLALSRLLVEVPRRVRCRPSETSG